jgi:hypothetical protein
MSMVSITPTIFSSARAGVVPASAFVTRAATCERFPRGGPGGSTRCSISSRRSGFSSSRRTIARVLAPGGVLVWHGGSRDGVMARFLERDWWKTSDGTLVAQERSFDSLSGRLTVMTMWSGPAGSGDREHHIRLYTPTRLAEVCADAGLIVEAAYDGFTPRPLKRRSSEMLLVARKTDAS